MGRRRRIVGTSLKMYFDYFKTLQYAHDVAELAKHHAKLPPLDPSGEQEIDVFVIPDFVSIVGVQDFLRESTTDIWVGAQDTYDEDAGAFTGEVSARTLAQVGCRIVEIGHAERRRLFGETDDWVLRKAKAIQRNGMLPLVCFGELTQSDDVQVAVDECWAQIGALLRTLPPASEIVLAYEPVWAIGKSHPASAAHIVAVTQAVRAKCHRDLPEKPDASVRILYGGSAGPGLYEQIYEGVDGLFLGRFAHKPDVFLDTVVEVLEAGKSA